MTTGDPADLDIRRRHVVLEELRMCARQMLDELAQVVGIVPPGLLHDAPSSVLDPMETFCRVTDFAAATEDGRTWMRNRLGLYIARYFLVRYGGRLDCNRTVRASSTCIT